MSVTHLHDPAYNAERQEAHDFVSQLGLEPTALENIAIFDEGTPQDVMLRESGAAATVGGGYNPTTNEAIIVNKTRPGEPLTGATSAAALRVHEIAHSASAYDGDHTFFNEVVPGIVEYKLLEKREALGLHRLAGDFALRRAGVELWVPNNWRRLHADESTGTPSEGATGGATSNGLVAALGVAHAMRVNGNGMTSRDILQASRLGSPAPGVLMRQSLNELKPGLAKEVESYPESTDGIIQATAAIQKVALKRR